MTPPLIVDAVPERARIPPLERVRIWPVLMARLAFDARVTEFTFKPAATFMVVEPEFNRMLLLATRVLAVSYSFAASGRISPVAVSAVAKEVPLPVVVLSTSAHGRMPLVFVAAAPVWPVKVKPPVEFAIVAIPAPATEPRLEPRKRTEAPEGAVPEFCAVVGLLAAALKTRLACRAASAVTVITE